jgi:hypothetical protein
MELIDYAEQQGRENFAWQCRVSDITRQEANVTLGLLVAGGGAALAWGISRAAEGTDPALAGAVLSLACWLFLLAGAVQLRCLRFSGAMPPANSPLQVYLPEYDTNGIREQQLGHLDQAISLAAAKGDARARALGRLRMLTCLSPVVFLAAWAVCHAMFR